MSDLEFTLLNSALINLGNHDYRPPLCGEVLRLPSNPWLYNTEKILAADIAIQNGAPIKQTLDVLLSQCVSGKSRKFSQLFSNSDNTPNLKDSLLETLSDEILFLANKKLEQENFDSKKSK